MIEIRIHGRGGQGAVTASEVLAIAVFKAGKYSQAFPSFGPERSGAPVEAYCRIDNKFINIRTHIYEPDYLLVLDSSLLYSIDITKGLKKNGMIVINSENKIKIKDFKVFNVNATKIAIDVLGKAIVNTAMLGAFAKATNLVSMKNLEEAIKERFPKDLAEKNILAIRKAYEECA
ncbi:MAG: pyruvate ferredoxin oxidoreductase subunit gamma [Candidatus Aenigmatarchaeota archaeon]